MPVALHTLETNARYTDSIVEYVYEPACFEADFCCNDFTNFVAPEIFVDTFPDGIPIFGAKFFHSLLICIEIVCLIFMGHFKDFMCGVPIFTHPNEVIDIEVYCRNMNTMKKTWLVLARSIFVEEWICLP